MSPLRPFVRILLPTALMAGATTTLPVGATAAPEAATAAARQATERDTLLLRYDLRPGDHLIYREVLEEEMDGRRPYGLTDPSDGSLGRPRVHRARGEWRVHLLVLDRDGSGVRVAWLRRRVDAESLDFVVDGEESPEAGRDRLERWLAPPGDSVRVHSHRVSDRGLWLSPPELVREWPSKVLWAVTELPLLPPDPPSTDPTWPGRAGFGFDYEILAYGSAVGRRCVEARGTAGAGMLLSRPGFLEDSLRMRWTFCPDTGLAERVEVTAPYPGFAFRRFEQRVSLEFLERRRAESVRDWLADPEVRAAALRGLNVTDPLADVPLEPVHRALRSEDPVTLREALTLLIRHDLPRPSREVTDALERHPDAEIARLAGILAEIGSRALSGTADDADATVDGTPLTTTARARTGGDLPCLARLGDPSSEVALEPLPLEPPGTTLRTMVSEGHAGWPFALHVPPEYTGDEPLPLVIYLAGNAGPMLEGILNGDAAFGPSPYLVLYPQAHSNWWTPESTRMMDALIYEALARYRVDTDRIYLSGLSNGGTGAFYYAALWPHRFTAVVPAMGAGLFAPWSRPQDIPVATNLAHLPTLFLHGEADPVVGVASTLHTVATMAEKGVAPEVATFPGRGHAIMPGRGDDGLTLDFFERHRRRVVPRSLEFEVSRPEHGRHYWAQIVEVRDPTAVPRVRAEAGENGRFALHTENVSRLRLLLPPELLPPGEAVIEVNGEELYRGPITPSCEILEASLDATRDPHLAYPVGLEIRVPRT